MPPIEETQWVKLDSFLWGKVVTAFSFFPLISRLCSEMSSEGNVPHDRANYRKALPSGACPGSMSRLEHLERIKISLYGIVAACNQIPEMDVIEAHIPNHLVY